MENDRSRSRYLPSVSIVIPVYNEADRIRASIYALKEFRNSFPGELEILLIVEKSTDESLEMARDAARSEPSIRVIDNLAHRGKGYAVKSGMARTRGEIAFFMDLDLSTPLTEVPRFLREFAETPEIDVLIGSRNHPEAVITRRQSWIRQSMGRVFNLLIRGLAIRNIRDTQCGFKAFRRAAMSDVFGRQTLDGFSFDVEVLLLASAMGYRIRSLPVRWENAPGSKVRILRDSIRMLLDLLTLKKRVRATLRAHPHPGKIAMEARAA